MRQVRDAIGAGAEHSFVERSMAGRSDHDKIEGVVASEVDDVPHDVPGDRPVLWSLCACRHLCCTPYIGLRGAPESD
jgi:hypothetical protein